MRRKIFSLITHLSFMIKEYVSHNLHWLIYIAMLLIFIIDLQLPLGIVAGVPYVLVVLISLWITGDRITYIITAMGVLFTTLGFYLSPGIVAPMEIVLINRGLTILLIVSIATIVLKIKQNRHDIATLLAQSIIDPLTQCKNRRAFEMELDAEILRSKRYQRDLTMAIIDIDEFKQLSESQDKAREEENIKKLHKIINDNIRNSDHLYRIGIDKFAVLFSETDLSKAKEASEAIRKLIFSKSEKNDQNKLTVSIGIAMLGTNDSKRKLCQRAEDALLVCKSNGKNQVATLPQVICKDKPHVAAILSRSRAD